ncbi:MocR-like pyridoxine biosynthesis transcription factor PdxR [Pseudomonas sp. SDO524_S393]
MIRKTGDLPMFRQIYQRFRESIKEGKLKAGDRVPSIRALASNLNVAPGTVEAAYQMLINEGYFLSRGPAGTIVSPLIKPTGPAPQTPSAPSPQPRMIHDGSLPLPLQMGLPALDAFPMAQWNRLAAHVLRHSQLEGMIYPDARGHPLLQRAVARYLGVSRGITCAPEQVFIVAGYRACLDLICRSLLNQNDQCWVEDPGYFAATRFLSEAGAELVPVPVDVEGLRVSDAIERAPNARFAVVTPTHQSPLCVHLSMPRRQALLEWANQRKSWVIEDDYDSEYRYQGRILPALKSLDEGNRVLYCGTFSKVLLPSLRLAYLVVPKPLIARFAQVADTMHSHCPHLWQVTTAQFIYDGHFGRHLKRMRELYAQRRDFMIEAIGAAFGPEWSVDHQVGGMHLVLRHAGEFDDQQAAALAKSAGLSVQPLSAWYVSSAPRKALLLGFTNVKDREQATRLAQQLYSAVMNSAAGNNTNSTASR